MQPRYWSRVWRTGGYIRLLSGVTLRPSEASRGVESWIASLRAIRASRTALPASAKAPTTTDGYSTTCCESSRKCGLVISSAEKRAGERGRAACRACPCTGANGLPRCGGSIQRGRSRGQPSARAVVRLGRPWRAGEAGDYQYDRGDPNKPNSDFDRTGEDLGNTARDDERRAWESREGARPEGADRGPSAGGALVHAERPERWPGESAGHEHDRHDAGRTEEASGIGESGVAVADSQYKRKGVRGSGVYKRGNPTLKGAAVNWPSPTARMVKGGGHAVDRPNGNSRLDMLDWAAEHFSPPAHPTPDGPPSFDADPLLHPAIGNVELWNIARRALGLPEMVDGVGRRGGMARDMESEAKAAAKFAIRRVADGLAPRVDRLRAGGNGVVALDAAYARRTLRAALAAGSE